MANSGVKRINDIIKSTLNVIEESRGAIFEISENARREVSSLKDELQLLKSEVQKTMAACEALENKVLKSRQRLAAINKDFNRYSEDEMKKAYQETSDLMVELAVARERESQTILRRNDVERRLKNALETVGKAEKLVTQVGTVLSYLTSDLQKMDEHIESSENKRTLALRIIKAQEDERRRVAREMHDGPAQAMSNVVLKAEICEKLAEVDMAKAVNELKNLKEVVRSCLKDVRRIIYDLRPMSIDDLGLKPTIQKYIEGFSQQYGIECEFRLRGDDNRIKDSNITLAVFRIVQECLNNIRKHAHASQVTIQMECAEKALILRIKDDGRGFDTGSLSEANRNENGGFGLFGMRERIELLEGSFGIESTVGMGTTVRVQLPYDLEGVFA